MKISAYSLAAAIIIPATMSFSAVAEHQEDSAPDPGDHTKVSTALTATYGVQSLGEDNNNFLRLQGQSSGKKENGHAFLAQLTLEGQENGQMGTEDFRASQLRARYFEVGHTGWDRASMLGVSLDYIENSFAEGPNDRLLAGGAVVRVQTPFSNWLAFPIIAAAYGQNNDDYRKAGIVDSSVVGGQFNFMNSIYLHQNGTHIQINPQFSSLDFGGHLGTVNSLQLDMAVQMPLSQDRKHWGKLTYTEYFDDIDQSFGLDKKSRQLLFSYSYYL